MSEHQICQYDCRHCLDYDGSAKPEADGAQRSPVSHEDRPDHLRDRDWNLRFSQYCCLDGNRGEFARRAKRGVPLGSSDSKVVKRQKHTGEAPYTKTSRW